VMVGTVTVTVGTTVVVAVGTTTVFVGTAVGVLIGVAVKPLETRTVTVARLFA
jgi:hypothetical protein